MDKNKIYNFLKYYSFPLIIFISVITFLSYMAFKEIRLENFLIKEALEGNSYAIQFLKKHEKPWKNNTIVKEAVKGNKFALMILEIDNEKDE